ncbi:peptidoglycan bridge formation glycyltransferase FemA/FemB family protein [Candidatus Saccharibacteria bacterium]|nr:peptidoglycan bridge formation glycyltransferase FemA/FemB family protein [Candidatus Saccharibacteria bacterium]
MKKLITQSEEWKNLQKALGVKIFDKSSKNYEYLAILKHTPVGNYLYLPYGPIIKNKAGAAEAKEDLITCAKNQNAIFIRVEPTDRESSVDFLKGAIKSKDISPADTWVLDLTASEEEIVSNFSQGTRTRFHNYEKKGLTVEVSKDPEDIKYLVDLQSKLAKVRGIHPYDADYLKTELSQPFASLYLVKYDAPESEGRPLKASKSAGQNNSGSSPKIIAASLFFDHDGTRYYMQSASDLEYKKLPATVALLTKAIFDAKAKGIKEFDFWGIAPDGADSTHPWYGFTEFKKSFGGHPVHYSGTYDIPVNPARYKLYQFLRRIKP